MNWTCVVRTCSCGVQNQTATHTTKKDFKRELKKALNTTENWAAD